MFVRAADSGSPPDAVSPEGVFDMFGPIARGAVVFAAVSSISLLAVWLFATPAVVSYSTFAFLTVIVLGAAVVMLMTWRNAQATDTVANILHATETATASTGRAARAR
jgi:hypothetical protein